MVGLGLIIRCLYFHCFAEDFELQVVAIIIEKICQKSYQSDWDKYDNRIWLSCRNFPSTHVFMEPFYVMFRLDNRTKVNCDGHHQFLICELGVHNKRMVTYLQMTTLIPTILSYHVNTHLDPCERRKSWHTVVQCYTASIDFTWRWRGWRQFNSTKTLIFTRSGFSQIWFWNTNWKGRPQLGEEKVLCKNGRKVTIGEGGKIEFMHKICIFNGGNHKIVFQYWEWNTRNGATFWLWYFRFGSNNHGMYM